MTRGITTALMGIFLLSAPAYAESNSVAAAVAAPKLHAAGSGPSYRVTLTGYNAVPGQTDSTPDETASGAFSNPEVVAARSVDLADELPFGTVVSIEPSAQQPGSCGYSLVKGSIGLRVIADSMNPKVRNKVDVLFDTSDRVTAGSRTVNAAIALGACKVTVRVVGHVAIAGIPRTQAELADALIGGSVLAVNR